MMGYLDKKKKEYGDKWHKRYSEPKPKPKAKAFVATDAGIVVPYSTLVDSVIFTPRSESLISKSASDTAASQQIQSENDWIFDNGLAPRPFDPTEMLVLLDNNPYFSRMVKQIAVDTAGLGHSLVLRDGGKENASEREKAELFFEKPDGENTLNEVNKRLITDWGYLGWLGVEVRRDGDGKVALVNHVQARSIWVHKSDIKYAQKAGTKIVWFKKYGVEEDISSSTGEDKNIISKANELIFYKEYYPGSPHYGVPNIYGSVGSVIGMIGIRDFNLSFFNNFGIPAYFILLEGDWDEDAEKIVTDFLKGCKDPNNAHKTMVFTTPEGCKITLTPIAVKAEEGSFKIFHDIWKEEILLAYSMPEYRIGIAVLGSLGGNVATEMTEIYKQSVIEPLQTVLEHIWSDLILRDGMSIMNYRLKFKDMETRDLDTEIDRATDMIRYGLTTPNDMRDRLDLGESYDGGDEYYIESGLVSVEMIGRDVPKQTIKAKLPKYVINLPKEFTKNIVDEKNTHVIIPVDLKELLRQPVSLASEGKKLLGFISFERDQQLQKSQNEGMFAYKYKFSPLAKVLPIRIKFGKLGDIISDSYRIIHGGL